MDSEQIELAPRAESAVLVRATPAEQTRLDRLERHPVMQTLLDHATEDRPDDGVWGLLNVDKLVSAAIANGSAQAMALAADYTETFPCLPEERQRKHVAVSTLLAPMSRALCPRSRSREARPVRRSRRRVRSGGRARGPDDPDPEPPLTADGGR